MSEELDKLKQRIKKDMNVSLLSGDDPSLKIEKIPTNIYSLDHIIGGGLPKRRFTLLFGSDGTGKSTLSALCAKAVQQSGGLVAYFDVEGAFNPDWWQKLGINLSNLLHIKTDVAEKLFDVLIELCKSKVDLIILDSIACLISKEEFAKGSEDKSVAALARLVNTSLKRIIQHNENSAIILINQVRSNVVGYGDRNFLPGGRGQLFDASLRLKVEKGDFISDPEAKKTKLGKKKHQGEDSLGYYMVIFVDKNKIGMPYRSCTIPIYFDGRVDPIYTLFDIGLQEGVIERRGAFYSVDSYKILGQEGFLDELRSDEKLLTIVKEKLFKGEGSNDKH